MTSTWRQQILRNAPFELFDQETRDQVRVLQFPLLSDLVIDEGETREILVLDDGEIQQQVVAVDLDENPEQKLAAKEYLEFLLAGLTFEERYVIILHFMDGYDWAEIPKETDYSIYEVRRYAMAAIRKMRAVAQHIQPMIH